MSLDRRKLGAPQRSDYLFALKGNHPLQIRFVAEYFARPPGKLAQFPTVDADHGRIETRVHRVSHKVDWLYSDRCYKDEPRRQPQR